MFSPHVVRAKRAGETSLFGPALRTTRGCALQGVTAVSDRCVRQAVGHTDLGCGGGPTANDVGDRGLPGPGRWAPPV